MTSPAETSRRRDLLGDLMDRRDLDALVIAANDYRGHKGALRWATGYDLPHKRGYAVVPRDSAAHLVLPTSLAEARGGDRDTPATYVAAPGAEVARLLQGSRRVGVVGMLDVMPVADHLLWREALPGVVLNDVSASFDAVRAVKSDEELDGLRSAVRIAELCFHRLVQVVEAGCTERWLNAEMHRVALDEGARETLFLTMSSSPAPDGSMVATYGPPADRRLRLGDQLIFSLELTGPEGYWCELARVITLGPATDAQRRLHAAAGQGLRAAVAAAVPGAVSSAPQLAIQRAATAAGVAVTATSGHAIGLDVIEPPIVAMTSAAGGRLEHGMVLAMHPFVHDTSGMAYLADCCVVGAGRVMSDLPLDLVELGV